MMSPDRSISILLIFILLLSTSVFFLQGAGENERVNSAPYEPSGPIPEDGESGVNTTPELSVYVTHPEDMRMNVSFYDNGTGTLIGVDEDVASGEMAAVTWEGLSPESEYSWYAVADDGEETAKGGPWNFSTAGVDHVRITDEPDGEVLSGGNVPPNHIEWGNLSAYNSTTGYVGNLVGRWSASGDAELMREELDTYNGIDVGASEGDVWFNVSYRETYNYSVKFTVLTDQVDRIRITDSPGGEPLSNETVPVGVRKRGYASAYNESSGYLYTVEGRWNAEGGTSGLLEENPATSNVIDVGTVGASVWFNFTYEGLEDSVKYDVEPPTIDSLVITDGSDGIPVEGGEVLVGETLWGHASGYNDTVGYVGLVQADWTVEGGEARLLNGTTASENGVDVGGTAGRVWFNASYDNSEDTVLLEVEDPQIDLIRVRNEPGGEGDEVNEVTVKRGEESSFYAAGYNTSIGYLEDPEVQWILEDGIGEIDREHGSSTTFEASDRGVGNLTARYEEGIESEVKINVEVDYAPEIVGEIPHLELEKDFGVHELNLTEYAHDEYDPLSEMRWYLEGLDGEVIETFGENQTGNHVITLMSKENAQGSMRVTYTLVNSLGNEAHQEAWINVTESYEAPEIRRCPDLKVHHGEPYQFDYSPYIIYERERKHELELRTDDEEHTTVSGLKITYEYPESMLGEEVLVMITVSDGVESDHTAITVEITSNMPPEETEKLPDLEIEQGQVKENVFDLDDYFTDPEGDPLYMSYGYTHLEITIHGDNTVDVKADVDWDGIETVTFRAKDPEGAIFEQTINVTVVPVNYPPEMKDLPDLVVHYDEPYTFDLEYYISDRDNETHELKITTDSPKYVLVDGTELMMVYPEELDGESAPYNVTLNISVSDGSDTVSQVIKVTVRDYYPPELLIPLHDVAFHEDEALTNAFVLDNHFVDRQDDTMYYSSGNDNIEVVIHENSSVDFYAPENWHGQELITIRATNSAGALMEDSLTVTVMPVNDPPEISDLPKQEGIAGRSWIFDIGDYISDVDNHTRELEITVEDPNVQVVGTKLIFDYDSPGTYNVEVEVSDSLDSTSEEIEVVVSSAESGGSFNYLYLVLAVIPLALLGAVRYLRKEGFTIEDVFLIHDSGVLIRHKSRGSDDERDEDILAGMFTAVNNFVGDAFGGEEKDTLKRMEYGDNKVLVHKGEKVILAVFITGEEPSWLLDSMSNLVGDIEERYEGVIEDWDGSHDKFDGVGDMLDEMIDKEGKYERGDWEEG
ncbi:MAG: Ig-like domain-containing protein [Candidatus Natronoplasma sp.]